MSPCCRCAPVDIVVLLFALPPLLPTLMKTVPQAKLIQLIKLAEGPGPSLQKATLDTVINELAQEGSIKRKTAPAPAVWAW